MYFMNAKDIIVVYIPDMFEFCEIFVDTSMGKERGWCREEVEMG